MAAKMILRTLTDEEQQAIAKLAQTRTAAARLVERARIIQAAAAGPSPGQSAAGLGCSRPTVYAWIRRFNDRGRRGLEERPRSGRPPTDTAEPHAAVRVVAWTDPKVLDRRFGCWTRDRLPADLNEPKGIAIKRRRIDEILTDEGAGHRGSKPSRRAGPAADRLRATRPGRPLRRVPPGHRRGVDPSRPQPSRGQLGRLPGAGRGLDPGCG